MQIADITAEVRDINLDVKGIITAKYLDIVVKPGLRGVGEWQVTLPGDHPMVPYLQTSGSGMIFSLYDLPYMSGPTNHPKEVKNQKNPDGTYTFTGVDDNIHLWHARAFPQPSNYDATTQTAANDVRTGNAETLMRAFVNANIGPGAPLQRRPVGSFRNKITLAANSNRGASSTRSPRFQILGELLSEIGVYANLGFRLIQVGGALEFQVLTLTDRSDLVELSVANGSLSSETLEKAPPSITRAIVAGQGEGVARQFVTRTTAASVAAEAEWGLIIEEYIDQRNTNVTAELQQAGDERLFEAGFTAVAVKAVPSDDQTMRLVKDWNVGDTVGLIQNGVPVKAVTTQAIIVANSKGVIVGAAIGDVSGFTAQAVMGAQLKDVASQLEALQRSIGTIPDVFKTDPNADRIVFWDDSAAAFAYLGLGPTLSITGTTLEAVLASTTASGAVELATSAETITGTDATRAVTPAGLASLTATATRSGLVELATPAEALTGTDTTRAVTPEGLKSAALDRIVVLEGRRRLLGEVISLNSISTLLTTSAADMPSMSLTAVARGNNVRVSADMYIQNGGSGSARIVNWQLLCDGVVLQSFVNAISAYSSGDNRMSFTAWARHVPTAASHTWKLQAWCGSASSCLMTGSIMKVEED